MNREGSLKDRSYWRAMLVMIASMLLLAAVACGGDDDDDAAGTTGAATGTSDGGGGEPIVIGAAVAETGIIAPFDGPALNGARLAVEEINEAGGVLGRQLEIVVADTESDINQGARAGLEVIDQGADVMLVSPDYNFGGGAAREAQKAGMLVFSSSAGSPKFGVQGIGDLAFTMGIAATTDGAVAAEWGYEDEGFRTAYVLLDDIADYNKDQCRGFETRWAELGGEIAGEDTFSNDDPSIATQVTKIKSLATPPDLIILCSFPPGGATAVKQLRDAGVDAPIISNNGFDGDFWYKDSMPDLTDFYFTGPASLWGNDPSDQINSFTEKYVAQFEQPQAVSAIGAYAAIYAMAEAMKATESTDGATLAAEIETWEHKDVGGLEVTFTPEQHIDSQREERIVALNNDEHTVAATRAAESQLPLFE